MTGQDAVRNFNLLYNNIDSNISPGLTLDEISLIMNKAQEELVKDYFNPKSNTKGEGIENSIKREADFNSLIKESTGTIIDNVLTYTDNDILFILSEIINNKPVILLSSEEYERTRMKPYPYPPKNQVWKVQTGNYTYKVITPSTATSCTFRYVKTPNPIDLSNSLDSSFSELPEHTHSEIIQRAVELSKSIWQGDINTTLQMGQRSE